MPETIESDSDDYACVYIGNKAAIFEINNKIVEVHISPVRSALHTHGDSITMNGFRFMLIRRNGRDDINVYHPPTDEFGKKKSYYWQFPYQIIEQ
jgi:hypothetical protein